MSMKKLSRTLYVIIFALATANMAGAAGGIWTAGGGSNLWQTPTNWQLGLPTSSDATYVTHDFTVSYAPVINAGVNAVSSQVLVGWAALSSGETSLTVNGGSLATPNLWLGLGGTNANHGTLNVNAGTVNAGTLIVGWQGGKGTLNMMGGTVNVTGTFFLPGDSTSTNYGELNLFDGLLDITGGFGWVDNKYHVEIQKGTMKIAGNYKDTIDIWASFGWWTGYGSGANIVTAYNQASNVTTVTAIPEPASMMLLGFGSLALLRRKHK